MTQSFKTLGLIPALQETVAERGYTAPTAIQAEAIPHLLAGRDIMGQAQTGTGKTAAFTLPMVQELHGKSLQTLILTPTRELAIQTADIVYQYGHKLGIRVLPIYGGTTYTRQIARLKKGVQVVVGTPGRTLDLVKKGILDLSGVRFLILDEADEMLKMGFVEDVEAILSATDAHTRQTSLFSATLSTQIQRLGSKYMNNPLTVAIKTDTMTVDNVTQCFYVVDESAKVAALSRLLEVEDVQNTLIFTRTKIGSTELAETLMSRGYPASAINGDLAQNERERILRRFRSGQLNILVATDVVARGVDIPDVSHVINFDIPQMPIEYVHRIGRTGRAGRSGHAITLITPRQGSHLKRIEYFIKCGITKSTLPTLKEVQQRRDNQFKTELLDKMEAYTGKSGNVIIAELNDMGYDPSHVAAAAIGLLRAQEEQRPLEEIKPAREVKGKQNHYNKNRRRGKPRGNRNENRRAS
ncbi:DEAD/DEAH box helicase [Chloroflexota bacterium]